MSILIDSTNQPRDPAKMASENLIAITKQTYQQILNTYNRGTRIFWKNPGGATPQQIANELGTNAKEIFELHYKLGQLLNSIKPADIAEANVLIGSFVMNDDGTVTINEQQ